jgi:hypothetical protein
MKGLGLFFLPFMAGAAGLLEGAAARPEELERWLSDLGLSKYKGVLVENGFESPSDVQGATEQDFEGMHVLRGHRRRLVAGAAGKDDAAGADELEKGGRVQQQLQQLSVDRVEQLLKGSPPVAAAAPPPPPPPPGTGGMVALGAQEGGGHKKFPSAPASAPGNLKVAVAVTVTHEEEGVWKPGGMWDGMVRRHSVCVFTICCLGLVRLAMVMLAHKSARTTSPPHTGVLHHHSSLSLITFLLPLLLSHTPPSTILSVNSNRQGCAGIQHV